MIAQPKRMAAVATAVCVIGLLVAASVATAIHPRPRSASPINASLVPAYEPCTAPDRTHGPPLGFPSCSAPAPASAAITVGTADANGAPANSAGFAKVKSWPCSPGPPDDCEVELFAEITDVRCMPATIACGSANAAAGADYTGEVRTDATLRMTDHFNAVAAGGGPDPATVVDIPFPIDFPCSGTASTAIGSTCSVRTLWNAVVPGSVKDTKRAVVELQQIQVMDGGADGDAGTAPNDVFAVQGVFIP